MSEICKVIVTDMIKSIQYACLILQVSNNLIAHKHLVEFPVFITYHEVGHNYRFQLSSYKHFQDTDSDMFFIHLPLFISNANYLCWKTSTLVNPP